MASAAQRLYRVIDELLAKVASSQQDRIQEAAAIIAGSIAADGILYLLGSGHSTAIAMEGYYRAGGLAPVDIVHDPTFGRAERIEGYAEVLLRDYGIPAGSVIVIISNSGRNALPIEVALLCRERGIKTVAVTSLSHTKSVGSRHSSGKKLFEIADVVIDNCGVPGDAALEIEGVQGRAIPTSGIVGMFIVDSIIAQVIENLVSMGVEPPVFISANVDGGDEHNEALVARYRGRIRGI